LKGVAPNFTPLLDIYGKGKNRFPLLVLFSHPFDWVVTLPSNNVNGEDGTIQAGEYAKGDTATFFVYSDPGHVDVSMMQEELLLKYCNSQTLRLSFTEHSKPTNGTF
jgi:hypothetical protein